jgi:hypothetical protein
MVMRAELVRHFDVVIVVWALALGVLWTMVALSRAELNPNQYCCDQPAGPVWVVYN